jgi:hypothetical protein
MRIEFTRHWMAALRSARPPLLVAAWLTLTTISGDPTAAGCISSLLPLNWQFATKTSLGHRGQIRGGGHMAKYATR